MDRAMSLGIITQDDWTRATHGGRSVGKDYQELLANTRKELEAYDAMMEMATGTTDSWARVTEGATVEMVAQTEEAIRGAAGMDAYRMGVEQVKTAEELRAEAMARSADETNNLTSSMSASIPVAQSLYDRVAQIEGTYTAEVNLRAYGLDSLEKANRLLNSLRGFNANDQPDPYSTVGNEELKQQRGDEYVVDPSKIPGFAMGGVVPGPLGSPQLILAHGGETVIPPGQNSLSVVQNFYGAPQNAMTQARDGLLDAARAIGLTGYA